MAVNYKSYELQLYELVGQLIKLLPPAQRGKLPAGWQRDLAQLRRSLEIRKFRVAVVGEMNRGKTSFVNALMGQELLPADYMPATAANNRITYGDETRAYVLMKDGEKRFVKMEELADYVTKRTKESAQMAAQVEEAVVEFPSLLCHNDVDIIDTPGMNDEEAMNQITISRLEDIDLAIVAIAAGTPFSMTEASFVLQLIENPQICQIIFVLTKMDILRPRDRQKLIDFMPERIRDSVWERIERVYESDSGIVEKFHALLDHPIVFPVSSLDAIDARSSNDMELYRASGFAALNEELPRIILSSQNSSVILNVERKVQEILRQYHQWAADDQDDWTRMMQISAELERSIQEEAQNTFPPSAIFLPSVSRETAIMRQKFISALANLRTLSYEELRALLVPVMQECFRERNEYFSKTQNQAIREFEAGLKVYRISVIQDQWVAALTPWPEILATVSDELAGLDDLFRYVEMEGEDEVFHWTVNPLPDRRNLKISWNVMPHVEQAIQISMEDYLQRRNQQLEDMRKASQKRLDKGIAHLVDVMRVAFADTSAKQKEYLQQTNFQIEIIAKEFETLKDHFLEEIRGQEQQGKRFRLGILGDVGSDVKMLVDAMLGETLLSEHSTNDLIGSDGGISSDIERHIIELSGPWEVCKKVDFVLSCGVCEEILNKRQSVLDGVVVVLSVDTFLSNRMASCCQRILQMRPTGALLFVLNKTDQVQEAGRNYYVQTIENSIRLWLKDKNIPADVHLFPVSAIEALEGRLTGDRERVRGSGIEALEQAILSMIGNA